MSTASWVRIFSRSSFTGSGFPSSSRSWLKYGIWARSKLSQPIHSGATSCDALKMPRWKEARRRLPARPSIRKSLWSMVCLSLAFSVLPLFPVWLTLLVLASNLCRIKNGQYQMYKLSSAQVPRPPWRRDIRGALRMGSGRLEGRETGQGSRCGTEHSFGYEQLTRNEQISGRVRSSAFLVCINLQEKRKAKERKMYMSLMS